MRFLPLLLLSLNAFAGDIPDLPVTGTYAEAASKAQQAAWIQSGVQGQIDLAKDQVSAYAIAKAKYLGLAKPVGAALYCARVYRDKAVDVRLSGSTTVRLEIRKASITFNF